MTVCEQETLRAGAWVWIEGGPLIGQLQEQAADGLWWVRLPCRNRLGLPFTDVQLPGVLLRIAINGIYSARAEETP